MGMNSQNTVPCGPVPRPTQGRSAGSIQSALPVPHRGPSNSCKARVFLVAILGFVSTARGMMELPLPPHLVLGLKIGTEKQYKPVQVAFQLTSMLSQTGTPVPVYNANYPLIDTWGIARRLQICRGSASDKLHWTLQSSGTDKVVFATMTTLPHGLPLTGAGQWEIPTPTGKYKLPRLGTTISTTALLKPVEFQKYKEITGVTTIFGLPHGDYFSKLCGKAERIRLRMYAWESTFQYEGYWKPTRYLDDFLKTIGREVNFINAATDTDPAKMTSLKAILENQTALAAK